MNSNYHALQASVDWLSWKGLSLLTSFTYGKAIQENRSYKQDNWNRAASRGLANADLPRAFVQSATFELPFGAGHKWMNHAGFLNQVIGGWQVNGIFTGGTGIPFQSPLPTFPEVFRFSNFRIVYAMATCRRAAAPFAALT